jgi:hypothetical protein
MSCGEDHDMTASAAFSSLPAETDAKQRTSSSAGSTESLSLAIPLAQLSCLGGTIRFKISSHVYLQIFLQVLYIYLSPE